MQIDCMNFIHNVNTLTDLDVIQKWRSKVVQFKPWIMDDEWLVSVPDCDRGGAAIVQVRKTMRPYIDFDLWPRDIVALIFDTLLSILKRSKQNIKLKLCLS